MKPAEQAKGLCGTARAAETAGKWGEAFKGHRGSQWRPPGRDRAGASSQGHIQDQERGQGHSLGLLPASSSFIGSTALSAAIHPPPQNHSQETPCSLCPSYQSPEYLVCCLTRHLGLFSPDLMMMRFSLSLGAVQGSPPVPVQGSPLHQHPAARGKARPRSVARAGAALGTRDGTDLASDSRGAAWPLPVTEAGSGPGDHKLLPHGQRHRDPQHLRGEGR